MATIFAAAVSQQLKHVGTAIETSVGQGYRIMSPMAVRPNNQFTHTSLRQMYNSKIVQDHKY